MEMQPSVTIFIEHYDSETRYPNLVSLSLLDLVSYSDEWLLGHAALLHMYELEASMVVTNIPTCIRVPEVLS